MAKTHSATSTAARIGEALATLAGPGVASAVRPLTDAGELIDAEETLVARAVQSRRREFAVGRRCARAALRRVG